MNNCAGSVLFKTKGAKNTVTQIRMAATRTVHHPQMPGELVQVRKEVK